VYFFPTPDSKSTVSTVGIFVYRLALPWSMMTTICYSFMLFTSNFGRDLVDEEICLTISDSATPLGTNEMKANIWLVSDRVNNFITHYLITISNGLLFMSCLKGKHNFAYTQKIPIFQIGILFINMSGIILIHTYIQKVYCVDDIYMSVGLIVAVFVFSHLFFYEMNRRFSISADA
jgi:hypothetical protein